MTDLQKLIKYFAIGMAVCLIVSICVGIFSVGSLINAFVTDAGDSMNSMEDYPVSGTVTELEINIGAAELIIVNGERFSLSANLSDLKVEQVESCLSVKQTLQFNKNYNGAQVRLTVPEGHVFQKLSISSGAGRLQAGSLSAQTLSLNLGAGQAEIRQLTAEKSALIHTGAGELTVSGGTLTDLDLEMGVGKVTLKSRLQGRCEVDQGVGEAVLELAGSLADYTVRVEKGLGSAEVDGHRVSDDTTCGSGQTEVNIDGGVGSIRVSFYG